MTGVSNFDIDIRTSTVHAAMFAGEKQDFVLLRTFAGRFSRR
jgi:hypothetical protein